MKNLALHFAAPEVRRDAASRGAMIPRGGSSGILSFFPLSCRTIYKIRLDTFWKLW